mmetsp:Transcript_20025/g.50499  ORF Transcript_20025/g.50499 Transcript_20025/m.50499 type:complete len:271 (+) Transcript_20025:576-1388(+)
MACFCVFHRLFAIGFTMRGGRTCTISLAPTQPFRSAGTGKNSTPHRLWSSAFSEMLYSSTSIRGCSRNSRNSKRGKGIFCSSRTSLELYFATCVSFESLSKYFTSSFSFSSRSPVSNALPPPSTFSRSAISNVPYRSFTRTLLATAAPPLPVLKSFFCLSISSFFNSSRRPGDVLRFPAASRNRTSRGSSLSEIINLRSSCSAFDAFTLPRFTKGDCDRSSSVSSTKPWAPSFPPFFFKRPPTPPIWGFSRFTISETKAPKRALLDFGAP